MATSQQAQHGASRSLPYLLFKIEPREFPAVLISFLYVFCLMAGYYVLRPIRDAMASDYTDAELSTLFTATFVFSLLVIPAFGLAASKLRLARFLPWVYGFMALNILAFFVVFREMPDNVWAGRAFYVWISVFNLFIISVFWSFMADIFTKEQSKRMFGFIAAGASLGAVSGPAITSLLTKEFGAMNLLPISAALIALPIVLIPILMRTATSAGDARATQVKDNFARTIGGNPFAGVTLFFKSKYLFGTGTFLIFYTFLGTLMYFQQKDLLAVYDSDTRTVILANIDVTVNVLAFLTQLMGTSRLATKFGLAVTLAFMPVVMIFGLLFFSFMPLLPVFIGLQILRRAGDYAITRPGREMLFTIVDPESKYKAKNAIDTVVYRGGDAGSAWTVTALGQQFAKLGEPAVISIMALIGAGVAAAWAINSALLGREYESRSSLDARPGHPARPAAKPASV